MRQPSSEGESKIRDLHARFLDLVAMGNSIGRLLGASVESLVRSLNERQEEIMDEIFQYFFQPSVLEK